MKIIDTHSFLGKSEVFGVKEDTENYFSLDRFKDIKFLTIAFDSSENLNLIKRVQENEKFLGCYLIFNPNKELSSWKESDSHSAISSLVKESFVIGLKSFPSLFHTPLNSDKYYPYYEIAVRNEIPVLLHCSGSGSDFSAASMVREICEMFPRLKLILAHFGGLKLEYMKEAIKLCQEFKNLYLNTTALDPEREKKQVSNNTNSAHEKRVSFTRDEIIKIFNEAVAKIPHQLLFGSDLGYYSPEEYSVWPINTLDSEKSRMICIENIIRLFGKKMKPMVYLY